MADFPTGWVEEHQDPNRATLCDTHLFDSSVANAEATFSQQGTLPQVAQRVGHFAPGGAAAAMADTRRTFDGCTSQTLDGITWKLGPTSFPALGDDRFAYLARGEGQGLSVAGLFVGVRSGDDVVTVAYGDFGSVDTTTATSYVRKALARLRAAQG